MPSALPMDDEGDRPATPAPWWRSSVRRLLSIVWFATFVLAFAVTIATVWLGASDRQSLWDAEEYGVRVHANAEVIPFSAEALKSGLHRGDVVIAVDGMPVPVVGAPPTDKSAMRLTVRSPQGEVSDHRLTRSRAHLDEFFAPSGVSADVATWFILLINAGANLVLIAAAALLFGRAKRQSLAGLLSFAFLLIALTMLNTTAFSWLGLSTLRMRIEITSWTLFLLAMMLFPDGYFRGRWSRWYAFVAVALTALALVATSLWRNWPAIHTALVIGAAASLVLKYRALPHGGERQQVRWALLGLVAGSASLVPAIYLDSFVLPSSPSPATFVWGVMIEFSLLTICLLLFAGGFFVSLLKYRLYDADAVISRSVSIGALTLTLLAVFAGTEKVIELLGEEYFGERLGVLAGGIGAAFAALMIVPLHHRLTHWAEHKFQKQLIRLKHGLPLLVGDMRETAPVARIAAATLDSVSHGVRASRSALVFEGVLLDARGIEADEVERWRAGWTPPPHEGFDTDRADPLFPLRVPLAADGHGRIGWLLLGPRPDGSFYGKDERETLATIADPVARALEIAAAREKREAEESQRWRAQESLNAEIKTVNSELVRILGSLDRKLGLLVPPPMAAE